MKSFDKFIAVVALIIICAFTAVNLWLFKSSDNNLYKVEINRVENEISAGNEIPLDSYDTITGIYEYNGEENFYDSPNEYAIREINGRLYRIEYDKKSNENKNALRTRVFVNSSLAVFTLIMLSLLLYVRQHILKPFNEISGLPHELAKGNLTVPLTESKSRYFGKFIWGLDMLREELEHSKLQRLDKMKAEKTLLLSLSHDTKTPLSAIKLYSKALSKGLYSDRRKQIEIAESIDKKADEIEHYINEIIRNSNSDFMTFEINMSEFYLSQSINKMLNSYREKLSSAGTLFEVNKYSDCILSGDPDRFDEVLQNIMENAIKYGDGRIISFSFSDEENCRLITVSNSGCTLADTELPHIFDSFWRGSNTGSQKGSGLGLYICRRLMTDMGGDIFAEISDEYMNVTLVCPKVS